MAMVCPSGKATRDRSCFCRPIEICWASVGPPRLTVKAGVAGVFLIGAGAEAGADDGVAEGGFDESVVGVGVVNRWSPNRCRVFFDMERGQTTGLVLSSHLKCNLSTHREGEYLG